VLEAILENVGVTLEPSAKILGAVLVSGKVTQLCAYKLPVKMLKKNAKANILLLKKNNFIPAIFVK